MRKFLEENIGMSAELTLAHNGQTAQIAGTIKGIRDDMVLLDTDDGFVAGNINHLLFAKVRTPQNMRQSTRKNPVPDDTENADTSAKIAPILNWTESRMQTIL